MGQDAQNSRLIVMEYLHSDLSHHIHQVVGSSLPLIDTIQFGRDICQAMVFLHSRRIPFIHRSLCSQHVLLDVHLRAKVTLVNCQRFRNSNGGSAKGTVTTSTNLSTCGLSVNYTAPELLFRSEGTIAADVYSFGVVLGEMASGQKPFGSIKREKIVESLRKGLRPSLPQRISTGFRHLILACWQQRRHNRPTFAQILLKLENLTTSPEEIPNIPKPPPLPSIEYAKNHLINRSPSTMSSSTGSSDWIDIDTDVDSDAPLNANKYKKKLSVHNVDVRGRRRSSFGNRFQSLPSLKQIQLTRPTSSQLLEQRRKLRNVDSNVMTLAPTSSGSLANNLDLWDSLQDAISKRREAILSAESQNSSTEDLDDSLKSWSSD